MIGNSIVSSLVVWDCGQGVTALPSDRLVDYVAESAEIAKEGVRDVVSASQTCHATIPRLKKSGRSSDTASRTIDRLIWLVFWGATHGNASLLCHIGILRRTSTFEYSQKLFCYFKLMMRLRLWIWIKSITDAQLPPRHQSYSKKLEFRGYTNLPAFSNNSLIRSLNDMALANCLCSKSAV